MDVLCFPKLNSRYSFECPSKASSEFSTLDLGMPDSECTHQSPTYFPTVLVSHVPQPINLEMVMVPIIEKSEMNPFRDIRLNS